MTDTDMHRTLGKTMAVALIRWALGLMFLTGGLAKLFMLKEFVLD